MILAAGLVILSMLVFAGAIVTRHIVAPMEKGPLTLHLSDARQNVGESGEPSWVVRGKIVNETDKIYGIPDLNVVMKDENGNIVGTAKFLAPMPLIDARESVEFAHVVSDVAPNARKLSVEFVK